MKRILIQFILVILSLQVIGQGLEDIYIEKIMVPSEIAANDDALSENSYAYRIFVDMAEDYGLSVVTGTQENSSFPEFKLIVETTTSFYNNQYGSTQGEGILAPLIAVDPAIIYDSYVCMGAAASNRIGVPVSENSDGYIEGTPTTTSFTPGLNLDPLKFGSTAKRLETSNGSWAAAVTGGVKGPNPESNMVMIGQFTTDGDLNFDLNVQLRDPFNSYTQYYVARYDKAVKEASGKKVIQFTPLLGRTGKDIHQPRISLLKPTKDSLVSEGDIVQFRFDLSDDDGTIEVVEMRSNTVKIGQDDTAPFEIDWAAVYGSHNLTFVAIDNDSAMDISGSIYIQVREASAESPPSVNLTNPQNDASFLVGDIITISANASDLDGTVDSVEFFLNDNKIGSALPPVFDYPWTAELGTFSLTARATDSDGLTKTSDPISILVVDPVINPPTISITSPADESVFEEGDLVSFIANATDLGGSVDSVEYYLDGTKVGVAFPDDFKFDWTADAGEFALSAKATDNDGMSSISDTITIRVNDVNDIPVVTITSPENNSTFNAGETVKIAADVTDDGNIVEVNFYIDDVLVRVDNNGSPYEYDWVSSPGTHEIKVIALDDNSASSLPVYVDIEIITGLHAHQSGNFWIYPNPAFNSLFIEFSGKMYPEECMVIDVTGKMIEVARLQHSTSQIQFDISALDTGLYFLKIEGEGITDVLKFIKQNR